LIQRGNMVDAARLVDPRVPLDDLVGAAD
jgi:hypothetical protein